MARLRALKNALVGIVRMMRERGLLKQAELKTLSAMIATEAELERKGEATEINVQGVRSILTGSSDMRPQLRVIAGGKGQSEE